MPTPPAHRTFADLSHHLVSLHPPKDAEVTQQLDSIRDPSAEATLAARAIHDACQRCIAAVILNQQE